MQSVKLGTRFGAPTPVSNQVYGQIRYLHFSLDTEINLLVLDQVFAFAAKARWRIRVNWGEATYLYALVNWLFIINLLSTPRPFCARIH